jgi:predicted enzyme related to lactoylglutathione lyase
MATTIVHFEVYVDDLERAKNFYATVLGWAFSHNDDTDYTLVYPGGQIAAEPAKVGINGGIVLRSGAESQDKKATPNAYVCIIAVEDIDTVLALVEKNGGSIDSPLDTAPGVGRLAYIRDTESNLVGILQPAQQPTPIVYPAKKPEDVTKEIFEQLKKQA